MKVHVKITTVGYGQCAVEITIKEKGDFVTGTIFQSQSDFPAGYHYQLFPGNTNTVCHTLPDPKSAQHWADAQIRSLENHLKVWRNEVFDHEYLVEL